MRNYFFALALLASCLYVYKLFAQTNKPSDYVIIEEIGASNLERQVELKIKAGYQPLGGIGSNGRYLYQAMIK
ncbi:hypothetical protein [Chitinophaga sp. S165]|uniref:hypothetical protein n=1 Tax=Chitinophaga sp. S165 TaxID=2135462 RepID=UPI000D715DB5|nr:hypothetical protein [Chitinophaga sp. S165]PWV56471.1 hypothetical protein C7475_101987 [Chitinophaga sp. S165]